MQNARVLSFAVAMAGVMAMVAAPIQAQVTFTPMVGAYTPASDIHQVTGNASNVAKTREGTLGLGGDLDFGPLRLTAMYASGTTLQNASKQDIGKGNVLSVAGALVIRPIPRIIVVQPYLIAGAGETFYKYDESAALLSGGNKSSFALHGGLGADVMLGGIGVAAELTDFVSKGVDDKWNVHDAFFMIGLRFRLGQ